MTARVELLIYWRVYIIINPFISIIIPYKTVLFPYKSHIPKDYLQGMLIPNLLIPKCGDFHLSLGDSTVVSKTNHCRTSPLVWFQPSKNPARDLPTEGSKWFLWPSKVHPFRDGTSHLENLRSVSYRKLQMESISFIWVIIGKIDEIWPL